MRFKVFVTGLLVLFSFILLNDAFAQRKSVTIKGTVFSSQTRKPVPFASVVAMNHQKKTTADENGNYLLTLDNPGKVVLYVSSTGLSPLKVEFDLQQSASRDFWLKPVTLSGGRLEIRGERKKQKLSRRTMRMEELKATPASFGDSINALTSLPGIDRTDGFFGPLVIRAMYPHHNRYYIDDMPINYPMHFGGIHSVIANELMSEIDLYASSFPSEYGGPLSSVIEINTVDDVKEFGGYADVGLISATALVKQPFYDIKPLDGGEEHKEYKGYLIVSGRVGYLSLFIPPIYETLFNEELDFVPEYWDYQVKTKYYINRYHSLTFMAIGARDYLKFLVTDDMADPDEGEDPLTGGLEFETDQMFHNQSLTYAADFDLFHNKLMVYSAWSQHYQYANATKTEAADWLKDFDIDTRPYICGIKDMFELEWWEKHAELRGAVEFNYYHFVVEGYSLAANSMNGVDLGDPDSVTKFDVSGKFINRTYGGYLENRFSFGSFLFVPGVNIQHLERTSQTTVDPRAMVSYSFPTETTFSVAGGKYSSFLQTNPYLFAEAPDITSLDYIEPEKAYHLAAGVEQKMDLLTLSIEGFYNYQYDLGVGYRHYVDGEFKRGLNSGKFKAYGAEIMLRKDIRQGKNDYFGWLSYTYTEAYFKSGVTGNAFDENGNDTGELWDTSGDKWSPADYDRTHALKLVLGYTQGKHTFSGRFQLYSSFPYSEIVGSEESPVGMTPPRYSPIYSDDTNTERFDIDHRLDLRYTYKTGYEWGHVSWYVELINVYGFWYKPKNSYTWRYDQEYESGKNPKVEKDSEGGLSVIPNFGVEVKF